MKSRARAVPPLLIVASTQIIAVVAWLVFFVITGTFPVAPGAAWPAVLTAGVLVMVMSGLMARASARGDISIVGPVIALSPLFTVLPDFILSGTLPSPLGWFGLALAVSGTASLSGAGGWLGRLRALFERPDALDALGAAMILGVVGAVDRWGARSMGPPSYLLCAHAVTAVVSTTLLFVTARGALRTHATSAIALTCLMHGVLSVSGTTMQTSALTMAPAAYVNAIRRMSAVVAVVLGRALFSEPDMGRRLAAALLACAGAACLLLAR